PWSPAGWPTADTNSGINYLPSCMLGVVHEHASTVDQVIQVLDRASKVDETFPQGTFVFSKTGNVRSTTRFPLFGSGVLLLKSLQQDAQIVASQQPKPGMTCVGVMFGSANIPVATRSWKFAEGAIAENLTSYSAAFKTASQTKITEFLHAGAVMSCGPVDEPYTLPTKFPTPMLYGYYAMGATAIESFYLSLQSPYQTLIVGDPLAAPFLVAPSDVVEINDSDMSDRFVVSCRPSAIGVAEQRAKALEYYVDGRLMQIAPPKYSVAVDLRGAPAGYIEARVTLVGQSALAPRRSIQRWVTIGDPPHIPTIDVEDSIATLRCDGAQTIELFHHVESLGTIQGDRGTITLDRATLGSGPLRLRAVATVDGKPVQGRPVDH
ncbi:hypothetical protein N9N28_14875, partial [Rubripirellula amarantea]|nr:hypothetical protein [Rubripirellula amarantea]